MIKLFQLFKKNIHQNIFNTGYKQNVLVAYITNPITRGTNRFHTNTQECLNICKAFKKMRFNVDLCNFDNKKKFDYSKYELVFGFGIQLYYAKKFSQKIKTIYYSTGLYSPLNDYQSLTKLKKKFQSERSLLSSLRLCMEHYYAEDLSSDYIVFLNNWINKIIYGDIFKKKIFALNVSFNNSKYNYKKYLPKKNYSEAKKNFIYFSGPGAIHKGLDDLIVFFSKNKKYSLNIFCRLSKERIFYKKYKKYFKDNILYHGYRDIESESLKNALNKSLFVIQPSIGEGQPSGLVNLSSFGLIPIVSLESGIKFDFNYFDFSNNKKDNLKKIIKNVSEINDEKLKNLSKHNYSFCKKEHSINNYYVNMVDIIQKIKLDIKNI